MQSVSTPRFRTATGPPPAEDTIGHMALQCECGMLSELSDLESQSRLGIVYGSVAGISAADGKSRRRAAARLSPTTLTLLPSLAV